MKKQSFVCKKCNKEYFYKNIHYGPVNIICEDCMAKLKRPSNTIENYVRNKSYAYVDD